MPFTLGVTRICVPKGENDMLTNLQQTRAWNLGYLRWRCGGHEALASKIEGILNWKYLSASVLRTKAISDYVARAIENRLGLTPGWIDRKNLELVDSPADVFELLELVQKTSSEKRAAIRTLLAAPL